MTAEIVTALLAGISALIGAGIQFAFQRRSKERADRRELIETHFLQLQDALESLYYRINNLRDLGGRRVMDDDYFRLTSVYAIGRVLAHGNLLITRGIYAKLQNDEPLKRTVKGGLHQIHCGLDNQQFLHYHRLQLAEMLVEEGKVITYSEYLTRSSQPTYASAMTAAVGFVESAAADNLDAIRNACREMIELLEEHTLVPSALSLATEAK